TEVVLNSSDPVAPPGTAGLNDTPWAVSESVGLSVCGSVTGALLSSYVPAVVNWPPEVLTELTVTGPDEGVMTVMSCGADVDATATAPKSTGEAPPSGALAGLPKPSTSPQ